MKVVRCHRPISNLSVISKLLKRLVARQLVTYLDANCLLPSTQLSFRREYSTETVIIRILSDLLDAVDRGNTTMLVLLNLSAAFELLTMQFCWRGCESLSVPTTQHWLGFDHTSLVDDSMYAAAANVQPSLTSSTACHRGRPWADTLSFTLLIWRRLSQNMACRYTNMLMTARYTAPVSLMLLRRCRIQRHDVSTASLTGCARTASNSMPTRRT